MTEDPLNHIKKTMSVKTAKNYDNMRNINSWNESSGVHSSQFKTKELKHFLLFFWSWAFGSGHELKTIQYFSPIFNVFH